MLKNSNKYNSIRNWSCISCDSINTQIEGFDILPMETAEEGLGKRYAFSHDMWAMTHNTDRETDEQIYT